MVRQQRHRRPRTAVVRLRTSHTAHVKLKNSHHWEPVSLHRHARYLRQPPCDQRRPSVEAEVEAIACPTRDGEDVLHCPEQLHPDDVIGRVNAEVEVADDRLDLLRALHVFGRHGY